MAVASGRAAMTLTASSALRSVVDVLEKGMEGIELGTGLFPGFADGKGGPEMAGLFLWILSGPKEEQEATWKLVKWLMEPEQQAEWFAGSGYLPVSRSSVDLPAAQDAVARYPLFRQVLNLYLNAPATPATLVAALGPFQKVREAVYRGMEEMLSGAKDPEQALKDAASNANEAIAEYNQRVGG
jgi:sn-glycerol 3-phosphate transport system substrate-binding protein